MLIGIAGHKFSGKSTVTDILSKSMGYEVRSFATKLKAMVVALTGCTLDDLENYDFKENGIVPEHLWAFCSNEKHNYRSLLQGLGDYMRDKNPEIFIESELYDNPKKCIISDCRMLNEAEAIKKRGGVIVRVIRDDAGNNDTHKSEVEIDMIEPDYLVYNNGTIDDLHKSLDTLTQLWKVFDV